MAQPVYVSMSLQLSLLRFSHRDSTHGGYIPAPIDVVTEASMLSRAAAMANVTMTTRKRQREEDDDDSHIPVVTVTPPSPREITALLYPSVRWWQDQATRQQDGEELVAARVSQQIFCRRFGVSAGHVDAHRSLDSEKGDIVTLQRRPQTSATQTLNDDQAMRTTIAGVHPGKNEGEIAENRETSSPDLRDDNLTVSTTTVAIAQCRRRLTLGELVPSCRRCLARALLVLLSPRVAPLVEVMLLEHDPRPSGKTALSLAPRCPDVVFFPPTTYTVTHDGLVSCSSSDATRVSFHRSFEATVSELFLRGVCSTAQESVDSWFSRSFSATTPETDEPDDPRTAKHLSSGVAASTRSCIRFVGHLAILQRVAFELGCCENGEGSTRMVPTEYRKPLQITLSLPDDPSAVPAQVAPRFSECGLGVCPGHLTWISVLVGDGGGGGVAYVALSLGTANDDVVWWLCWGAGAREPERAGTPADADVSFGRSLSALKRAIANAASEAGLR